MVGLLNFNNNPTTKEKDPPTRHLSLHHFIFLRVLYSCLWIRFHLVFSPIFYNFQGLSLSILTDYETMLLLCTCKFKCRFWMFNVQHYFYGMERWELYDQLLQNLRKHIIQPTTIKLTDMHQVEHELGENLIWWGTDTQAKKASSNYCSPNKQLPKTLRQLVHFY